MSAAFILPFRRSVACNTASNAVLGLFSPSACVLTQQTSDFSTEGPQQVERVPRAKLQTMLLWQVLAGSMNLAWNMNLATKSQPVSCERRALKSFTTHGSTRLTAQIPLESLLPCYMELCVHCRAQRSRCRSANGFISEVFYPLASCQSHCRQVQRCSPLTTHCLSRPLVHSPPWCPTMLCQFTMLR